MDIIADFYFQTPVYKQNKPNFLKDCMDVFDEQVKLKKAEPDFKLDPIHPFVQTYNLLDSRLDDFCTYVNQVGWNILQSQGYDVINYETYANEVWGQEHYKYSSMEYHYHPESVLTGFYILSAPNNSSKINFYDPRSYKNFYTGLPLNERLRTTTDINVATNIIFYEPQEGDLFITNSWLPHSFTRNESDEPLKFIHFNIFTTFVPKCNPAIVI